MKILTTKTLQRLLVTGALMLQINGCDDTVSVEQNTSVDSEVNVTVTPTVNPTALSLSVGATTLNKTDHANLTLMGSYADGSTKPLETQAQWIVLPTGSVEVYGTTFTALKDGNVTVQAKVGTTLSNKVHLDITWVVNGHTLPPEPDKALNDSTLLGIDTNNNGVRDDVERWIYDRYRESHPVMIPLKMQAARAYQKIIVDPSKAWETYHIMDDAQNCEWVFTSLSANYFGRKPLVLIEPEDAIKEDNEMEYIQYNTTQRARAYGNYNQTLSGGVFELEDPSEKWIKNCDFNTTKYIEMSEKL
ncbi:MAG TPA: hypothetical protein ENJ34_01175 [Epsilonproteobacteria bacterium]|nr:hypothetical protein [Campylobacterota bacterium]